MILMRIDTLFKLTALIAGPLVLLPSCATDGLVTRTNAAHASASEISRTSREALAALYAQNRAAKSLGTKAKAILVFPSVTRAGMMLGGQAGNGAMLTRDGRGLGFFQTASVSWGLQAGVQQFSYALFLMDDDAVRKFNRAKGWEVGSSPTLVIVDEGIASSLTTSTINSGTYAFFFNQRGLMAGLGLKGTKITRIHPGP
jgi:lipid-binding SYLF domain-containing protein